MSKLVIMGIAGVLALGGLAVLPQISTAAATATYSSVPAATVAEGDQPAVQPPAQRPASVGFGPSGYYAPAFAAGTQAGYRTCFMKRSVAFTAQGPKAVMTPTCAD